VYCTAACRRKRKRSLLTSGMMVMCTVLLLVQHAEEKDERDGRAMMKKKYCRADDEERGRHLVATERIDAGSLVFMERPLLCQQSLANSHEGALACRHCKCFIGSPAVGLQLTCGLLTRQDLCNKLATNQNQQGEEKKIVSCRQFCGELYCSNSCEQIHWESSGHCLLCTVTYILPAR
jgi:hypothetical protein